MTRPARIAPVPDPIPTQPAEPEPWRRLAEVAALLGCSRAHLDAAVRDGLPHLDLARPRPGCRPKRAIRLRLSDVEVFFNGARR